MYTRSSRKRRTTTRSCSAVRNESTITQEEEEEEEVAAVAKEGDKDEGIIGRRKTTKRQRKCSAKNKEEQNVIDVDTNNNTNICNNDGGHDDDDDDDEVEIVSPPPSSARHMANDDDDDDEVQFIGSNGKNALADFPHSRENCVVHPFNNNHKGKKKNDNNNNNARFCENCYCYVCDIPASDCCDNDNNPNTKNNVWKDIHCHARHDVKKWQKLRKQQQQQKKKKKQKEEEQKKKQQQKSPGQQQQQPSSSGSLGLLETTRNYYRRLQPPKSKANKRYGILPFGTKMILKGLLNKPERNGDSGEVLQYDDTGNGGGRYIVYLYEKTNDTTPNNTNRNSDNGIIIKVKPINVLQMNVKATLYGLQSKATLNGRSATIVGWDHQRERYYISYTTTTTTTTTNTTISVKPSNIVYSKGTIVQIMGANQQQQQQQQQSYDSKWGTVVEFIDYGSSSASSTVSSSVGNKTTTTKTTTTTCNGRYDIQLSTNTIVRVKLDTVRV